MRLTAKLIVVMFACFLTVGCGDDDNGEAENGNQHENQHENGANHAQEATDECMEAAATERECESFEDCPAILCFCEDGESSGNTQMCTLGTCGEPESHCPGGCEGADAGAWTGECEATED